MNNEYFWNKFAHITGQPHVHADQVGMGRWSDTTENAGPLQPWTKEHAERMKSVLDDEWSKRFDLPLGKLPTKDRNDDR